MAVWVCGEALIDLIPVRPGSDQRQAIPGGGPANTAHALARLDIPTEFIGGLSDDQYGQRMRAEFIAGRVGLTFTPEHQLPTCLAIVSIDVDGGATYEFKIDGTATFAFTAENLPDPKVIQPDAIYIGTLATIIEPGASILKDWIIQAKDYAPIIYDPNIRSSVISDRSRYQEVVKEWVALSNVVKASEDDLAWLYPETDPLEIARSWVTQGVQVVVITKGENGIVGVTENQEVSIPGVKVEVIDSVGAGDTVGAVLVEALVEFGLEKLTSELLSHTLHRAALAAAITCSRAGANPPTKAELLQR
jgi:fructokinase